MSSSHWVSEQSTVRNWSHSFSEIGTFKLAFIQVTINVYNISKWETINILLRTWHKHAQVIRFYNFPQIHTHIHTYINIYTCIYGYKHSLIAITKSIFFKCSRACSYKTANFFTKYIKFLLQYYLYT